LNETGHFNLRFMDASINFTLNGKPRTLTTDLARSLLDVLREDLHLTGTKFGCGEGECRACTVLINGECMPSCLTPIGAVAGQDVVTIEGLADAGTLHPVQEAFLNEGAFQCGYCTAGMIMGAAGVLRKNPKASEAEVLSELQKHICRCGSYVKYLKAVRRVLAQTGKQIA
jgi:aerobic-type carbon monoxide dehydrogenase small subunit (CoxS/CutS family)